MEEVPVISSRDRLLLGDPESSSRTDEDFVASFDLTRIPTMPGCYLMRDARGHVIYVGKAINLRARLRTYVNDQDSRYSVKFLMRRVADIEFLVTTTEKEALLLENSLIKEHRPRYNIRLKDDKTYISLRLNVQEDFPRVTVVRRYKRDGAKYFGPYSSAHSVRETLKQIQHMFPLRTCADAVMNNRTRPCLYYQMKQCVAPCVGHVDRASYHEIVNQVVMVLEGRNDELERLLLEKIQAHADALEFEKAAVLRDRLLALRRTLERQRTAGLGGAQDRDVLGIHNHGHFSEVQVLFFRGGKMVGGRSYTFKEREMPADEVVSSFILQYYADTGAVPDEILIPIALEEADTLSDILSEKRGKKVVVHQPFRGEKLALVDLAQRNAKHSFEEKQLAQEANTGLLEELRDKLRLKRLPHRIECFDSPTTQGAEAVGAMVVFEGGVANKSRYRRYAIRLVEGQDDFAMLREVLLRRYRKAVETNDLPDFALIDGGKGQLGVAMAVFQDLGIEDLDVGRIAKSRGAGEGVRSPERLFLPGRKDPVILPQSSAVVRLLARIRDEAHRFAITYHRKRRGKAALHTPLTDIPGVGPMRAKSLLNALGSLRKIGDASVESIAQAPGFNETLARAVKAYLAASASITPQRREK